MTPYFRSYAANFNRVRLLEMIDYREPPPQRREMQRSLNDIDNAYSREFHAEPLAFAQDAEGTTRRR